MSPSLDRPGERDRVLHRELRARADAEVRRVRGVAEQDDVALAPERVAHGDEADPARAVLDQAVAEQRLAGRLVEREGVGRLDDERAHRVAVRVRVDLDDAALGLLDHELERVEDVVGAEPGVRGLAAVQRRLEAVALAQRAVDAVGGDHQVAFELGHLAAEAQLDAERRRARLQDVQQLLAAERREPVPAAGHHLVAVVDVDVAPADEAARDLVVALGIGRLERGQRLVGEDDAEAERVVGRVALVDHDLVGGVEPLEQDREVEPAGAAARDRDPHGATIAIL